MIKEKIKSKKGITLVALVITIVILLILASTVVYNLNNSNKVVAYDNMVADIELLEDKILIYFNKYTEIPKTSRSIKINNVNYYEIDLSKLENVTLNFGSEYNQTSKLNEESDVYLVNDSLDVYYLRGTELSGELSHEN